MTLERRLDIRDKCFRVNEDRGCLVIKGGKLVLGESFIMCVEGDERILSSAFDEYLASDVFNHYVRCRDINYLKDTLKNVKIIKVEGVKENITFKPLESFT